MSPQSCQMLLALALGFGFAGLCCSAYRLATNRLPSLSLLSCGPRLSAFAALALLIVAAPFLIMRTILLGGGDALDRFQVVFLATLLAGSWSLMSGLALLMTLQALFA